MSLHVTRSLAFSSLVAGAAVFALGCGGGESISKKTHDHSTHSHAGDGDGDATGGGLPTGETGEGHAGHGGHEGHEGHGDMGDKGGGTMTAEQLVAAEMAAYEKAKPVFDEYCSTCHVPKKGKKKPSDAVKHFDMSSYPFGGHHAHELGATIRKVLGVGGGKATMPADDPGAVQGDELELILAWAQAYEKTHAAGAGHHKGHGGGHEH